MLFGRTWWEREALYLTYITSGSFLHPQLRHYFQRKISFDKLRSNAMAVSNGRDTLLNNWSLESRLSHQPDACALNLFIELQFLSLSLNLEPSRLPPEWALGLGRLYRRALGYIDSSHCVCDVRTQVPAAHPLLARAPWRPEKEPWRSRSPPDALTVSLQERWAQFNIYREREHNNLIRVISICRVTDV